MLGGSGLILLYKRWLFRFPWSLLAEWSSSHSTVAIATLLQANLLLNHLEDVLSPIDPLDRVVPEEVDVLVADDVRLGDRLLVL